MAKFILEVTDEYIRERANVETIKKLAEQKGANLLSLMADMMVFSSLEQELDKGNNEFIFHLSISQGMA